MATDDVAVLRVIGVYQDQNIVNTFHYIAEDQQSSDVDVWQQLADDWVAANATIWLARHVDTYVLEGVKVFTKRGSGLPPGVKIVDLSGTVVGTPNDALIGRTITLYTSSPNPRLRGRLQLSGSDVAMFDVNTGQVNAAEVDDLTTLGSQLNQLITEGDNIYRMVLYNKLLDVASEIIQAKGRVTPSVVRSRRARQFLVG